MNALDTCGDNAPHKARMMATATAMRSSLSHHPSAAASVSESERREHEAPRGLPAGGTGACRGCIRH